jgi:branched-subunit amino acid ABC-type transport system permease component
MVFPPGHLQQVERVNAPANRGQRRRVVASVCATLLACAVGFTVWSLTKSGPRTGNGCIAFSFMTVVGGSSDSACGSTARSLCLAPVPKLVRDGDYYAEMHLACRRAGLPTAADIKASSS